MELEIVDSWQSAPRAIDYTSFRVKKFVADCHCWYCGIALTNESHSLSGFTLDHITPISRGGSNNSDNLVCACRSCNSRKCAKTLSEYRHLCGMQNPAYSTRFHALAAVSSKKLSAADMIAVRNFLSSLSTPEITFFGETA